MRILFAAALVAVFCCPSARARADVAIDGPWWTQRAVSEMQAPVAPGQTVLLGACPGWPGLAACNFPTLDSPIYMRREFYTRSALARELGGRFDTLAMTPAARWHFMRIMRYRGPWWATDTTLSGYDEFFEDAYADCALGFIRRRETLQRPDNRWVDFAGYDPTRRQHARVCALIERVGGWAGYETPAHQSPE